MTSAMLATAGEQPTASEGFVDLLGSTRLADVTILFKEVGPEETRVSVRTSSLADAVAITSAFGGGGHARAAGCTVAAPIEAAREHGPGRGRAGAGTRRCSGSLTSTSRSGRPPTTWSTSSAA